MDKNKEATFQSGLARLMWGYSQIFGGLVLLYAIAEMLSFVFTGNYLWQGPSFDVEFEHLLYPFKDAITMWGIPIALAIAPGAAAPYVSNAENAFQALIFAIVGSIVAGALIAVFGGICLALLLIPLAFLGLMVVIIKGLFAIHWIFGLVGAIVGFSIIGGLLGLGAESAGGNFIAIILKVDD